MKRTTWVLSSAALWLGSASGALAQSSVQIYGVADAAIDAANAGTGTLKRVTTGGLTGSRLGFRGSEDLGGDLKAVFKLEMGINFDDGTLGQGSRAFGREASVGLQSRRLGTLTLGRMATPYYVTLPSVDAFAYMGSGGFLALTRSGATSQQLLPMAVAARQDNAVNYVSPNFDGVEARAQASLGEGSSVIGRGYGASLGYAKGAVNASVAFQRQDGAGPNPGRIDAMTAGGSYDFGPVKGFLGYTREKNGCRSCTGSLARPTGVASTGAGDFRLVNAGARVPFGDLTLVAQYTRLQDRSTYAVATGSRDANWFAIGSEYLLSKRTLIYNSAGIISNANGSRYVLGTGTVQQGAGFAGATDPRAKAVNLGIRHLF